MCYDKSASLALFLEERFQFGFELASVVVNDSVTREAISRKQERDLLKFIKEDKHFSKYYDGIYILFHTGLRISEFCGLTIQDVEFEEMRIKVEHQLQRTSQMEYVIQQPKIESGIRYVPMTEEIASCFRRIIANRAGSQNRANGRWVCWFSVSGQERYAHGSASLGEVHGAYCPEV